MEIHIESLSKIVESESIPISMKRPLKEEHSTANQITKSTINTKDENPGIEDTHNDYNAKIEPKFSFHITGFVVGLLGDFKAGKTFLVRHLENFQVSNGLTDYTKGLCLKKTKNGNLLLDCQGNNTPITCKNDFINSNLYSS